jgi:virginiamycin B lyase
MRKSTRFITTIAGSTSQIDGRPRARNGTRWVAWWGLAGTAFLLSSVTAAAAAEQVAIGAYPVPSYAAGPSEITAGPDGALWFTENDGPYGNRIGRITTAGQASEYPIPTANSLPDGITAGPDGALWFVESAGNKIGRITTGGVITEYPLPTADANPEGITAGPDGALWFTEYVANQIGRITTSGVVTEYSGLTVDAGADRITAGPDGALWFTENFVGKIGRITTGGAVTEYAVPTPGSKPIGIAAGPDSALWFTEYAGNKIGRISTAGAFTEYAIPTANSFPWGITAAPDGQLWFAETGTNFDIGSITTAGTITQHPVPGRTFSYYITPGQDGSLWFTEFNANMIGQVVFPTATLSVTPHQGSYQTSLSFSGSSFVPNEHVLIYTSGVGSPLLVGAAADASGSFTATVAAPQSVNGVRLFLGVGHHSGKLGAANYRVNALLTLDPTSGPVNSTVVASGYGFGASEPLEIHWPNIIRAVATMTADINGSFSGSNAVTFRVPSGAAPGAYTVVAKGTSFEIPEASATFTVP